MTDGAGQLTLRFAREPDAAAIAKLHADSWRRNYRVAYPDEFFGPTLDEDRAAVWTQRLSEPQGAATIIAETQGEVAGFAHLAFDEDPVWGTLLDNLHVRHDVQRQGMGALLLARAAEVVETQTDRGMYLWVLEPNVRAQAFYSALGSTEKDRRPVGPPALPHIVGIRYVWDVTQLDALARNG